MNDMVLWKYRGGRNSQSTSGELENFVKEMTSWKKMVSKAESGQHLRGNESVKKNCEIFGMFRHLIGTGAMNYIVIKTYYTYNLTTLIICYSNM